MREALYPVPQGPGNLTPPSRLLVGKTDPAVDKPASTLRGKGQDVLTVRLPLLIPFVYPPLVNAYPPVILQGKFRDPFTVRSPLLFQPPLPAGPALISRAVIRGLGQDFFTVRSPFLVNLLPPPIVLPLPIFLQGRPQIAAGSNERLPKLFKLPPAVVVVAGNLIYIPTFRPRRR